VAWWWLLTNVTLIDVSSDPIEAITEAGHSEEGQEYTVEAIVFAIGPRCDDGCAVGGRHQWHRWIDAQGERPEELSGSRHRRIPKSLHNHRARQPLVLTNMLPSIDQHVEWPMRRVSAPQKKQPN